MILKSPKFWIPVSILALFYVSVVYLFYANQDRIVYFPDKGACITPKAFRMPYEAVPLVTSDGVKLSGWYIPRYRAKRTVLICHGNAGHMGSCYGMIAAYRGLGFNVMVFDYRGFGASEGSPDEEGTYRDAEAAWDYLVNVKKTQPGDIVLVGRSLGGAIAAYLASSRGPRALILESAFVSIDQLGGEAYPFMPIKLISRYDYNTEEYVKKTACPVLVVHSKNDELVPFSHGLKLYAAANPPKGFVEISGRHNEGYGSSELKYIAGLKAFFKELP